MDDTQRVQILTAVGYATGVAGALAPKLMARTFGVRDTSGELAATTRMMSLRNVALAATLSAVAENERLRKRFFTIAAMLFAADTIAALVAGASGKVSPRTAVSLGATTAGLAAVAGSGISS